MSNTPIATDDLAEAKRHAVIAEAQLCARLLDYQTQELRVAEQETEPLRRMVSRSAITTQIAAACGWSEGQVRSRMHAVRTVHDRTPTAWTAFQTGDIDLSAVREIAHTIDTLHEIESVTELDAKVVAYAAGHTVGELRRWLRRFVERVEAEHALARAEEQRNNRYVRIDHGDDAMSWITAYVPSPAAGAIERRLHKEARAITGDDRTLAQREADLLVAWATNGEDGQTAPHAEIAVVVDADILAGARDGFAESSDGAWSAPAAWITEIATAGNPFWYRMLREPVTGDILTIEYRGRFAPKLLRRALEFRYRTCAVPGCLTPAWKCEIDHQLPWPRGSTTAANTQPLSKTHHGQKGHGLLPGHATAA